MSQEETTHLSDAELHDVVVVAIAASEAEALYLMGCLEEAGIPATQNLDTIRYHNPVPLPDLRVPRALAGRARALIESARRQAQAHEPEQAAADAQDATRSDPVLAEMLLLAQMPLDERNAQLATHITQWFAKGRDYDAITRYLDAAGLSPDEARVLVADVYEGQRERVEHKQANSARHGAFFAALGVLIFVTGMLASPPSGLARLMGAVLFVIGISKMLGGSSRGSTAPKDIPEKVSRD